jgi:hypothetical protein
MSPMTAPAYSIGVVKRFIKVQLSVMVGGLCVYLALYLLLPNAAAAAFIWAGGCLPAFVGLPYGFLQAWDRLKTSIREEVTAAERTMSRARNVCIAVGGLSLAALVLVRPMTWTLAAAVGVLGLGNAISLAITFELIRRDLAAR